MAKVNQEISEQYRLAKRYLDPVHERMNKQEELYRTYINEQNYPHGAKVFDPRVFRVIETITPRMVSNEPMGSFYPREKSDRLVNEVFNELLKYDWSRAGMFEKLVRFVKSMLIFGTAFGMTYWDYNEVTRKRMVPKQIGGRNVWMPDNTEDITVVLNDNPNFETLNIYDCFPDPNATSRETMRWFILREFKTIKEMEEENKARGTEYYSNLKELKRLVGEKEKVSGKPQDMQYREHRRMMLHTEELIGEDIANSDITLLRRFERDRWVTIAPEYGDLVVCDRENPRFDNEIPIIYGVDYVYPGELYGMGEIEPVDRIQRAINAVMNQRLDNVQLTLRSMWKVKKGAGVDIHKLISAPGNVITMNDLNALEPIQVPDVTGPYFVDTMNYLTSAFQSGTAITDYTVGINDRANVTNRTATGARLIQNEANAQFKLKIQLFNKMVVELIANHFKNLRIQYTTEEQSLRIIGKDRVRELMETTQLSKTDLDGNEIFPGQLDVMSKLEVSPTGEFAFLHLLPEDMQPSIVGDYDFIAKVSSESIDDPAILQENFFTALDKVANPLWVKGLAEQGKALNYADLTSKVFDKLNLGMIESDVLVDIAQQMLPQTAPQESSMLMPQGGEMPLGGQQ